MAQNDGQKNIYFPRALSFLMAWKFFTLVTANVGILIMFVLQSNETYQLGGIIFAGMVIVSIILRLIANAFRSWAYLLGQVVLGILAVTPAIAKTSDLASLGIVIAAITFSMIFEHSDALGKEETKIASKLD